MGIPQGYLPPPEELATFLALPKIEGPEDIGADFVRHWFACMMPGARAIDDRVYGKCLTCATGSKPEMPAPFCPCHPGHRMHWMGNEYTLPDGRRVRYRF